MVNDTLTKSLPSPAFVGHRQIMTGHVPLATRLLRASRDNFEGWLWALCFHNYFRWIVSCIFFSPPTLRPGVRSCVWSFTCAYLFIIFPLHVFTILYFFCWFAQYCLFKIPLLRTGESDTAPTNKIYHRASSEQRPRTRSCHESERLV